MKHGVRVWCAALLTGWACFGTAAAQGAGDTVYRCPGDPVLYTDALSAKEAMDKGCRTLDGASITIIHGPKPRVASSVPPATASSPASARIDPAVQRARDSDARRILGNELKREEERLAGLQAEYKDGHPDRLGGERNYQKYLDRVAELKAGIARAQGDIAALKRELAKHP
ncbi:MAG TPA: hypothetical protein VFG60_02335 [Burkholderiaceae bacterium]|nr:hypothetical protein [Burkholderiaceae bacterium]